MPLNSSGNKGPQQHSSNGLSFGRPSVARPRSLWLPSFQRQCFCARSVLAGPLSASLGGSLVMFIAGFRRVWPIHLHFLCLISNAIGSCLVLSHNSPFEITSGHLMPRMFLRHLLIKAWSLWVLVLVTRHVSEPYSRTDSTFVVKIRILLWTRGLLKYAPKLTRA